MNNENYKEDWAIYFCTVGENQTIGSVLVDLGLENFAPVKDKEYLTTVTTYMKSPREDGLSSAEESETLNKIEDHFIDLIIKKFNSIYAGRLKYDGKILSYFYSDKSEEYESVFANVKRQYPTYRFDYDIKLEENWRAYFEVLYPSEFEMQIIQNGRVIENLENQGDKLQKERPVDHWIYFSSKDDRENFLNAINDKNFEVVEKGKTKDESRAFSLRLSRVDKADYENVNEYVMYLWEKAQEFNGDYDGWETLVIKD